MQKSPRPYSDCNVIFGHIGPVRHPAHWMRLQPSLVAQLADLSPIADFDSMRLSCLPGARSPDAINSPLYAACKRSEGMSFEARGSYGLRRVIRRLARVAVSARRTAAPLALGLRLVRVGPAAVGNLGGRARSAAPPAAPRLSARRISAACSGTWATATGFATS